MPRRFERHHLVRHRLLVGLLILVAVSGIVGGAAPAGAHAALVATTPGDGAVLDAAPAEILIQFNEEISVQSDGVRVLGSDRERVDAGQARAAANMVVVPLRDDVGDGGYVVAWRIVSADGHPVNGAFTFSVGAPTSVDAGLADAAFGADSDQRDAVTWAVLRGLAYLGALVACGAVLVGAGLHRRGERTPVTRLAGWAAVVGIAASVVQLPVLASMATGRGFGALTEDGVLELVLANGMGWSLVVTVAGLIAILITVGLPFGGAVRMVAIAGALVAPVGFAFYGHTRTMSPRAPAYLSDVIHLFAAAVWLGGLVVLIGVVRRRRSFDDDDGAIDAVVRFSGWAGAILAALVISGGIMSAIEVGGLEALRSTTYGKLLMAKLAAVGLVVVGAGWNRFRLMPHLARGDHDAPWTRLLTIVRLEVVGIVVALAVTAVLVNVTPARSAMIPGIQATQVELETGRVDIVVDPARPGPNDVHVYLFDHESQVDDRFEGVTVTLTLPDEDVGPFEREPVKVGPGHYQVVAGDIPLGGTWEVTVTLRVDRFTQEKVTVEIPIR